MSDLSPLDRETVVDEIKRLLPSPHREEAGLDGSLVIVGGDPGEVIVRLAGGRISVSEFTIRWEGPHTPVVCPRHIAAINWQRLSASNAMMLLHLLITAVSEARRAKYRKCERCGQTKPPEWMHGEDICSSCAKRHLGVVY